MQDFEEQETLAFDEIGGGELERSVSSDFALTTAAFDDSAGRSLGGAEEDDEDGDEFRDFLGGLGIDLS